MRDGAASRPPAQPKAAVTGAGCRTTDAQMGATEAMANPPAPARHRSHHDHDARGTSPPGPDAASNRARSWTARAFAAASGAIGTAAGIAPHLLHHVVPIAGAAFVTGATGSIVFGIGGLLLTIPMLLRLRRRFGTWVAPAIALVLFAAAFSVSTFVIGPAIRGDDGATGIEEQQVDPHGH